MARTDEDIIEALADAVLEMHVDLATRAAHEAIEAGLDAYDAITNGLVKGMNRAGQRYEEEEYFVPELLFCAEAMYAGLDVLRPHLKPDGTPIKKKCVIGVVQGDTHDIGKNLVKLLLEVAGFEIHDLGKNVPLDRFVEKAKEVDADLVCLSTLMTTTMDAMATVIEMLKEEGIRDRFKVLVGGGPISRAFAEAIGADGYAVNAAAAVRVAKGSCDVAGAPAA